MALGISIFCAAMIIKNNQNSNKGDESDSNVESVQSENGIAAFDSLLKGTGSIVSEELNIGGVPCMVHYIDNYEVRPIMILQHGMTSKKEDMQPFATAFAEKGYLVVTPDAAAHGELKNKDSWTVPDMIHKTAENFDIVLNDFAKSSYVDIERLGMSGISLGGLSVFHYVENGGYNPKVVVAMCATPEYGDLVTSTVATSYIKNGKIAEQKDEEKRNQIIETFIQESPYNAVLADTDTCYYLLCGDQDDIVPHQGNVKLYDEMKDSAKDIVLQVKSGQGHTVTEDDLWEILSYVIAHL